jgi:hypothetical protein
MEQNMTINMEQGYIVVFIGVQWGPYIFYSPGFHFTSLRPWGMVYIVAWLVEFSVSTFGRKFDNFSYLYLACKCQISECVLFQVIFKLQFELPSKPFSR